MPAKASAAEESLPTILQKAPDRTHDELVVVRGMIAKGPNANEFILQRYATSSSEYAIIDVSAVIGNPIAVPDHLLAQDELGAEIHAVRLREGTVVRHFREFDYHVGTDPMPVHIATEYAMGQAATADPHTDMLADLLRVAAEDRADYRVFPGVVRSGNAADTICLDVEAPQHGEIGFIKRADIVEPNAIMRLPDSQLPIQKRGLPIHLVKVKNGAVIRVVLERPAKVTRLTPVHAQPARQATCACQQDSAVGPVAERSEPSHGGRHVYARGIGPSCVQVSGRCPWDNSVGSICQTEGASCSWITNSRCETRQGWWKNCYCDCYWE